MRGMPYSQASRKADAHEPKPNSYLDEALAIQAANRPPRSPPKSMPVTPQLPRVAKHKRRRRSS
jgi:hypothetical protein